MDFLETKLKGCFVIQSNPYIDERGSFERLYCEDSFKDKGLNYKFINTNYSFNKFAGTLRGMHMQKEPYSEVKLVKCVEGSIFDVAIDMREDSLTRYKWFGLTLSSNNNKQLYIPKGFAHGYQSLEDNSAVTYMVSNVYHPESEIGICYNDPKISINWPIAVKRISKKDSSLTHIFN